MTVMIIELRYGQLRFGDLIRTLFYKWIISKPSFGHLVDSRLHYSRALEKYS
jgi:hypothetical protein